MWVEWSSYKIDEEGSVDELKGSQFVKIFNKGIYLGIFLRIRDKR